MLAAASAVRKAATGPRHQSAVAPAEVGRHWTEDSRPHLRLWQASRGSQSPPDEVGEVTTPHAVKGHFLSGKELEGITSIECLERRQKDRTASCGEAALPVHEVAREADGPPWHVSNYPHFTNPKCGSGGEFFCDPDQQLSTSERNNVTKALKEFRMAEYVKCPGAPGASAVNRNFNLGIALARDWSSLEADPDTLQLFGLATMSFWGMGGGEEAVRSSCPAYGLIVVLGEPAHVLVAAPTCLFICKDRGGPEVSTTVLAMVDAEKGLSKALEAGIDEASRVIRGLQQAPPEYVIPSRRQEDIGTAMVKDEATWYISQQIMFVLVFFVAVGTLGVLFVGAMFPDVAHNMGLVNFKRT